MPGAGQQYVVRAQARSSRDGRHSHCLGHQNQSLRFPDRHGAPELATQPAWCKSQMITRAGEEGRGGRGARPPNEQHTLSLCPAEVSAQSATRLHALWCGHARVHACRLWVGGTSGDTEHRLLSDFRAPSRGCTGEAGQARAGKQGVWEGGSTLYMSRRAGTGRRTRSGTWKPFSGFHLTGSCARLL